ncbi:kinase-like protein [Scleroderma yunnanense]
MPAEIGECEARRQIEGAQSAHREASFSGALIPFSSSIRSDHGHYHDLSLSRALFLMPLYIHCRRFSDILQITGGHGSDLSSVVVRHTALHLDHDEHGILQFVEEHFPNIAGPYALGLVTIHGNRWPSLSTEGKMHISSVSVNVLIALRKLELPRGAPFGSPIGHHVCKDVWRDERNWLRLMPRHPRNIMVDDRLDYIIELSGVIDWETSGFCPEYWEQLKVLNIRSTKDMTDWYNHEVVLDRVIKSSMVYGVIP